MVSNRRAIASVVATLLVAAGLCGGAWATPNKQQYDNPGASEPTTVAPTTPTTVAPATPSAKPAKTTAPAVAGTLTPPTQAQAVESGTLPFTGQNIALVVLVGGVLIAAGIGLRRARWHDR